MEILENKSSYGEQRSKINANFKETLDELSRLDKKIDDLPEPIIESIVTVHDLYLDTTRAPEMLGDIFVNGSIAFPYVTFQQVLDGISERGLTSKIKISLMAGTDLSNEDIIIDNLSDVIIDASSVPAIDTVRVGNIRILGNSSNIGIFGLDVYGTVESAPTGGRIVYQNCTFHNKFSISPSGDVERYLFDCEFSEDISIGGIGHAEIGFYRCRTNKKESSADDAKVLRPILTINNENAMVTLDSCYDFSVIIDNLSKLRVRNSNLIPNEGNYALNVKDTCTGFIKLVSGNTRGSFADDDISLHEIYIGTNATATLGVFEADWKKSILRCEIIPQHIHNMVPDAPKDGWEYTRGMFGWRRFYTEAGNYWVPFQTPESWDLRKVVIRDDGAVVMLGFNNANAQSFSFVTYDGIHGHYTVMQQGHNYLDIDINRSNGNLIAVSPIPSVASIVYSDDNAETWKNYPSTPITKLPHCVVTIETDYWEWGKHKVIVGGQDGLILVDTNQEGFVNKSKTAFSDYLFIAGANCVRSVEDSRYPQNTIVLLSITGHIVASTDNGETFEYVGQAPMSIKDICWSEKHQKFIITGARSTPETVVTLDIMGRNIEFIYAMPGEWRSVTCGGEKIVFVGNDGFIMSTDDLKSFNMKDSPNRIDLASVASIRQHNVITKTSDFASRGSLPLFVAVGYGNKDGAMIASATQIIPALGGGYYVR